MTTVQKKENKNQKFSFRGYTPDQINEFTQEQIVELFRARQRRRFAKSTSFTYLRNQAQIQQTIHEMQKSKKDMRPR